MKAYKVKQLGHMEFYAKDENEAEWLAWVLTRMEAVFWLMETWT